MWIIVTFKIIIKSPLLCITRLCFIISDEWFHSHFLPFVPRQTINRKWLKFELRYFYEYLQEIKTNSNVSFWLLTGHKFVFKFFRNFPFFCLLYFSTFPQQTHFPTEISHIPTSQYWKLMYVLYMEVLKKIKYNFLLFLRQMENKTKRTENYEKRKKNRVKQYHKNMFIHIRIPFYCFSRNRQYNYWWWNTKKKKKIIILHS